MDDQQRSKDDLISELKQVRKRVLELESCLKLESPTDNITFDNPAKSSHDYRPLHELMENTKNLEQLVIARTAELNEINDKLRLSEERFRLVLANSPIVLFNQDRELRYTWMNSPSNGYDEEEILGRTDEELFPDDYNHLTELKRKVIATGIGERQEVRTTILGETFYYDLFIYPASDADGSVTGVNCISTDITERKLAEKALSDSEERFKKAFEYSPTLMTITRIRDLRHIAVNEAWLNTFGYTRAEFLDERANQGNFLINPHAPSDLMELIKANGVYNNMDLQAMTKSGDVKTLICSWSIISLENEPCILGNAIDITARKKVEEALRLSEEKFSKAFHGTPIMMVLGTLNGTYIDCNEVLCSVSGYTREEIIGRNNKHIKPFLDPKNAYKWSQSLIETGTFVEKELSVVTKSGEIRQCTVWSQLIQIEHLPCHITCAIDITEQIQLQKDIARLNTLNLIGEMAASIGHEIRNPMTSVRGFLQLLNEQEHYHKDKVYFDLMIEELDRANAIITEYLNMAKNKIVDLKPKCLKKVIKAIYPVMEADANYRSINLKLDLDKTSMALVDENEIRQLILNIVRNGMEAMSPGGTLTIGTQAKEDTTILYIADQGHGLNPDLTDKLGTPFVTTKDNGTGLGLAVCYSIAARHKATIDYETGNSGTTFFIKFPHISENTAS